MTQNASQPPSRISQVEKHALESTQDPILRKMLDEERVESKVWDTTLFLHLLTYLKPHSLLASLTILLALLEAFSMTAPAYLIGLAMDRVANPSTRTDSTVVQLLDRGAQSFSETFSEPLGLSSPAASIVVFFGIFTGLIWIFRWCIASITTYQMQRLGQLVVHDLRTDIHHHITGLDAQFFHSNPIGRLVNRTTFDTQALAQLFSDVTAQGLRDILFISVLVSVMVSLDPILASILVGTFPFLVAVALTFRRFARPAMRTASAIQSRMNAWLAENLAGMRENQLYRTELRRRGEFKALTEAHQNASAYVIRSWALLRPGMILTTAVATVFILVVGSWRVSAAIITVGVLLTFLQYTVRLWVPIRNLIEKFNLVQTALTSGERVLDILEAQPNIATRDDFNPDARVQRGDLEFKDVTFRYPKKDSDVLRSLSFHLPAGKTLALVGDTGAGKSTIVRLVSRFYDVSSGAVTIDGHDVRSFHLPTLRESTALVPQDVVIFAGTIRENITLGRDIPEERIHACINAVRADLILERFPNGLDHILEEGGRTLSTGERQLLSFARALVTEPPILILDEATANVDTETELLIQNALETLTQGRTSIVIAHRLSTIRDADIILVLRHGQIVERGSHDELLALNGEYARLVELHHRE